MRNSIALSQRVSPFYRDRLHILHTFLRLLRKRLSWFYRSNCAKKSCNRVLVGTMVDRQFSTAFAFELTSGTVDSWHGKLDVRFRRILTSSTQQLCPIRPCAPSLTDRIPLFLRPGPKNDHCPAPNLFTYWETRLAFDSHSFSLSLDHHEMSLNIDMNVILPVKFSGVSPNLNSKTFALFAELHSIESWENIPFEFHWLTHAVFDWVSRESYQDTIQNLKRRRPSCAEDWWLVHHRSKTNTSMKSFPNQLFSLHRSHLVRSPILEICQTSVSMWDCSLYFW